MWNALDVLCGQRQPLDLVLVEPSFRSNGGMAEWAIIETVCRPRWVVIASSSLPQHAGWIQARLQAIPEEWLEMFRGHYTQTDSYWGGWQELLRLRTFSIFMRRGT